MKIFKRIDTALQRTRLEMIEEYPLDIGDLKFEISYNSKMVKNLVKVTVADFIPEIIKKKINNTFS